MLENLHNDILQLEKNVSFDPNHVYYYNAQRSIELVLQLQNRHNDFNEQNVYDIFRESGITNIEKVTLNRSKGAGHIIAFVDTKNQHTYVYRQTFGLPTPESYMLFEKDIVEKYKTLDIASVDILASGSKPWFEWQIMEALPDENLKEVACTQAEYDNLSLQIWEIIAKQYSLPHEWWGRIFKDENNILRWYKKSHHDHLTAYLWYDLDVMGLSQIVDEASIALLKNYIAGSKTQQMFSDTKSYLIDNDLPEHNVRVNKDRTKITAIYDWENAVIFDPICELWSLPTRVSQYPKKEKLIEWFRSHLNKTNIWANVDVSSFDEKIAIYFLRTMLWKMPLAIKGNKLLARHVDLFEEALRDNKLTIKINEEAKKILTWNR